MNTDDDNAITQQPFNRPTAVTQITAHVEGSQNVAIGEQITQITQYIGLSAEDVRRLLEDFVRSQKQRIWDGRRPYVGLEAFSEQNAEFFFGREQLIAGLLDSVRKASFVAVAGPSGSGKSSLVQAGLISAIRQGRIAGSHAWRIATMTPLGQPIEQLALSMARLAGTPIAAEYIRTMGHTRKSALLEQAETILSAASGQRLFLFVDQFEELFTQTRNEGERRKFLDLLTTAATAAACRVIIVVALRSDFLSHAAAYAGLREQINRSFHLVGAMESEELAKAISLPALAVGAEIEPDLVAQVIADMRGEPGALPLMQFALKDLFDATAREPGTAVPLTRSDYLARGGIFEALERYANGVFDKLDAAQQTTARRIYTHLIEVGRGTLDTRRTADFRELADAERDPASLEAVAQVLTDARLLTTDATSDDSVRTITIAHEKLIEAWPWLRQLVSENRDAIALQNDIADDARRWDESDRDLSYLYGGALLDTVLEQVAAETIVLAGLTEEFIAAATAEREAKRASERFAQQHELQQAQDLAEAQRKRAETEKQAALRLQKRNRWLMAAFAGAMGALLLAILFFIQSQYSAAAARQAAVLAKAGELAANSALELQTGDTTKALLLSAEALSMTLGNGLVEPPLVRNALHASLQAYRGLAIDGPWPATPTRLAVSHDGALVAIGGSDGSVRIGPVVAEGLTEFTVTVPVVGTVAAIAFSPDDRQIAVANSGGTYIQLVIASARNGSIVKRISPIWLRSLRAPYELTYSPNGQVVAVVGASPVAYLLEIQSERVTSLQGHTGQALYGIAFTSDGRFVATSGDDRTVRIWHTTDGTPMQTLDIDPSMADDPWSAGLTFLHDDQWLIATTGGFLNLWERQTAEDGGVTYVHRWTDRGHQDTIKRLTKDHSGNCIVTVSFDQGAKIWRPSASAAGRLWTFPIRNASDAVFWNTTADLEPQSECSNRLLTAGQDAILRTWNAGQSREMATIDPGHGTIRALRFLPGDNSKIVTGADDGTLSLIDVAAHTVVTSTAAHEDAISAVALAEDGALLATASADGGVKLWQMPGLAMVCDNPALHSGAINAVVFDRAGRHLLTVGDDRRVILLDPQNCATPIWEHKITEQLKGAVFLTNDEWIVVAGENYLWPMHTDGIAAPGQIKHGHDPAAALILLGKSDQFLSIGMGDESEERAPHVWHITTGGKIELVKQVDNLHRNNVYAAARNPASPQALSGGRDDAAVVWNYESAQEVDRLTGFTGEIRAVDISDDGHYAVIAGEEGMIRIYALDTKTLLQEGKRRVDGTLTPVDCGYYGSIVCSTSPEIAVREGP